MNPEPVEEIGAPAAEAPDEAARAAPEGAGQAPAEPAEPAQPGPRALSETPPSTTFGGYGQLVARWTKVGPDAPYDGDASVRRLVIFVFHDFGVAPVRTYAELEWEDAVSGAGLGGSAEVEQAVVEWAPRGPFTLRAGLVLVPMGIVNEHHEPPAFFGVERPEVDTFVIPSTWRELGVGARLRGGPVRAELDLLTPLDPTRLGPDGVVNARTLGSSSPTDGIAAAGRVELEPWLGQVVGLSGYAAQAGGAADWYDATGERLRLSVPLYAGEVHLRGRLGALQGRAVGAAWWIPEADDLLEAHRADGSLWFPDSAGLVPTRIVGGYVEAGVDVLRPFAKARGELSPFARLEAYDLHDAVPEGEEADPARSVQVGTFGFSWKPFPALALKADVQLRDRRYGLDELQWNAGLGYLF